MTHIGRGENHERECLEMSEDIKIRIKNSNNERAITRVQEAFLKDLEAGDTETFDYLQKTKNDLRYTIEDELRGEHSSTFDYIFKDWTVEDAVEYYYILYGKKIELKKNTINIDSQTSPTPNQTPKPDTEKIAETNNIRKSIREMKNRDEEEYEGYRRIDVVLRSLRILNNKVDDLVNTQKVRFRYGAKIKKVRQAIEMFKRNPSNEYNADDTSHKDKDQEDKNTEIKQHQEWLKRVEEILNDKSLTNKKKHKQISGITNFQYKPSIQLKSSFLESRDQNKN